MRKAVINDGDFVWRCSRSAHHLNRRVSVSGQAPVRGLRALSPQNSCDEAIQRMRVALSEYQISGIKTNIALHQKVLQDPEFLAGDVHTRYLDKFLPRPVVRPAAAEQKRLAAVA